MNVYIIVEGDRTETNVYPAWLDILVPSLKRVYRKEDLCDGNYYLFSGHGIPSIYDHIAAAIEDINAINATGTVTIDYLMVCMDTEDGSREDILQEIEASLDALNIKLNPPCSLEVFEHKVSMESWFLGNVRLLSSNTQSAKLRTYRAFYDVRSNDPEMMDNIDSEKFHSKAQFHYSYLKEIFKENNITYSKSKPDEVCKKHYLSRLIDRYEKSGHIASFGHWYEFVTTKFQP